MNSATAEHWILHLPISQREFPKFIIAFANYKTAWQMSLDGNLSGDERRAWEARRDEAKRDCFLAVSRMRDSL